LAIRSSQQPNERLRTLLPQRGALYRFIRKLVRVSSDAEDIVQDAYLKLLERPPADREGQPLPGYLFVVARNLAADRTRRSLREGRRDAALHAFTTQLGAVDPSGEELVFVEQASQELRRALWDLPQRTRDAFLLHRLEGLTHQEVAALLGVTVRTVERNVASAIGHLKCTLFSKESSSWK
jgi:RNA polymerase sigma factor (sigma-70 family)